MIAISPWISVLLNSFKNPAERGNNSIEEI